MATRCPSGLCPCDSVRHPCGLFVWDRIYGWQQIPSITDPNLWTDAFLPMDQQLLKQVLRNGFTAKYRR
eukprot:symbB.v1.2.011145.t1/scaffold732.1/size241626/19